MLSPTLTEDLAYAEALKRWKESPPAAVGGVAAATVGVEVGGDDGVLTLSA